MFIWRWQARTIAGVEPCFAPLQIWAGCEPVRYGLLEPEEGACRSRISIESMEKGLGAGGPYSFFENWLRFEPNWAVIRRDISTLASQLQQMFPRRFGNRACIGWNLVPAYTLNPVGR